jgi:hypothetical protein
MNQIKRLNDMTHWQGEDTPSPGIRPRRAVGNLLKIKEENRPDHGLH